MLLTSKTDTLVLDPKTPIKTGEPRTYLPEHKYLLNFAPNHYDLPIGKDVFDAAIVGGHYDLDLKIEDVPSLQKNIED